VIHVKEDDPVRSWKAFGVRRLCALLPILVVLACTARVHGAVHEDARGLRVEVPPGFSATPYGKEGATRGGLVVAEEKAPAAYAIVGFEVLAKPPASYLELMDQMVRRNNAQPQKVKLVSSQVQSKAPFLAAREYRVVRNGQTFVSALMLHSTGRACSMYFVTCPASRWQKTRPTLMGILESFRVQTKVAEPMYVAYREPSQNAFSVMVPNGWKVEASVVRWSPMTVGTRLAAHAPDASAYIELADPMPVSFALPNALLAQAGFGEGARYEPMPGEPHVVMQWRQPERFLAELVLPRLPAPLSQLRVSGARPLPQVGLRMSRQVAQMQVVGRASLVDVALADGRLSGQALATVYGSQDAMSGVGGWNGYWRLWIATPAAQDAARRAFEVVTGTFQLNPQWWAAEQQRIMAQSGIIGAANEDISALIRETYDYKTRVDDEVSRKQQEGTMGTVTVVDAETGQQHVVQNNANYWWIKNDTLLGTQAEERPDINFRLMEKLP
jgi:hypothetical protein